MLKELNEISKKAEVKIVINTDSNNEMNVVVIFDLKDKNDKTLNIAPIVIGGPAEELESEMIEAIIMFTQQNLSAIDRIAFLTKQLKAAEEEVAESSKTPAKKKTVAAKKKRLLEEEKIEKAKPKELFDIGTANAKTSTTTSKAIATIEEAIIPELKEEPITTPVLTEEVKAIAEVIEKKIEVVKEPIVEPIPVPIFEIPNLEIPKFEEEIKKELIEKPGIPEHQIIVASTPKIVEVLVPDDLQPSDAGQLEVPEIVTKEVIVPTPKLELEDIPLYELEPLEEVIKKPITLKEQFDSIILLAQKWKISTQSIKFEKQTKDSLDQLESLLAKRIILIKNK